MLAAAHRLRRSVDFERTVRRGTRAGRPTLVVHLHTASGSGEENPPQVGLVVSKAVGNAVRRNKVKRRIRSSISGRLADLPARTSVVVRALPPSASASYESLDADLHSCLKRAIRKAERGTRDDRRALAERRSPISDTRDVGTMTAPRESTNGGTTA